MKNLENMTQQEKDKFIKKLWLEFTDTVILDEDDKIDRDFFIWKEGTDRNVIWNWFDDNYSEGLAEGLMELE